MFRINFAINQKSQNHLVYNEVQNYIDARYVSAPEAMWRLLKNKMHNRSHTVIRLPVHLPGRQRIIFEEGNEEQALYYAQRKLCRRNILT